MANASGVGHVTESVQPVNEVDIELSGEVSAVVSRKGVFASPAMRK